MVRNMGILRERGGLLEAERTVAFWCRYALGREFDSPAGWELQNLLTIARLMIWSALQRTESRGTHYRSDCPERQGLVAEAPCLPCRASREPLRHGVSYTFLVPGAAGDEEGNETGKVGTMPQGTLGGAARP